MPQAPPEAEPQPWHGLYWRAWDDLRYDRQYGAFGGEAPISYTTIRDWARDHGIAGDEFHIFKTLFTALDDTWLDHVAEQMRQRAAAGKGNRS